MVGALADWFAVTALFRHPLGIKIPHTAIIPRKKDQLGESLSGFVGENSLSPPVVAAKLRGARVSDASGPGCRRGRTPSASPPSWPPWSAARWRCCATTRSRP